MNSKFKVGETVKAKRGDSFFYFEIFDIQWNYHLNCYKYSDGQCWYLESELYKMEDK